MESQSNTPTVQPGAWRRYFDPRIQPRAGQAALWSAVASITKTTYFSVMCTGYGKTIAACGAYAIARAQKRANRMLVLVPTDQQRTQWSNAAKSNMKSCGVSILGAYQLSKEPRDFKYANDGKAEVFVATYQQAKDDPSYWERLLSVGQWFVVYDECHHLFADGSWAQSTHAFDTAIRLYMTATPMRHDRRSLLGIPSLNLGDGRLEYITDARVDYAEALKEKAVRPVEVMIHHYFIDVELPDGRIERITTEKLRAEGVTDFGDYEHKKQLRYKEKYLSPILLGAVSQLQALDAVHPGQHQMLVFAMSQKHAEHVARVLNAMPDSDGRFADWIGVDRAAKTNAAVLEDYLQGKLQCLVQIDMAGEGFDNPRCSVGVFLHLIKSATKNTQQIGRLVRRNAAVSEVDDQCHIFTSADSPVLDVALDFERSADLVLKEQERGPLRERADEPRIVTIAPSSVVGVEFERVEVRSVGGSGPSVDMQKAASGAEFLRQCGVPNVELIPLDTLVRVHDANSSKQAVRAPATELFATENGRVSYWKERVKKAVGVLARNVVVLRAEPAGENGERRVERSLLGDTIRAINGEWLRQTDMPHDAMTAEELERKHEWVRQINERLKEKGVPAWLLV